MGVSMSTVHSLRDAGYDAVHLRDERLMKMQDPDILAKARAEERVVLTFDLDFGDLLAASGENLPSVVIFRLRNQTPAAVTPRLLSVLSDCEVDLARGSVVLVEEAHYRIRRLPIQ